MSHSQFQSKGFILRLAWLSLWDERMTTGRINQVAFFNKGPKSIRNSHTTCGRDKQTDQTFDLVWGLQFTNNCQNKASRRHARSKAKSWWWRARVFRRQLREPLSYMYPAKNWKRYPKFASNRAKLNFVSRYYGFSSTASSKVWLLQKEKSLIHRPKPSQRQPLVAFNARVIGGSHSLLPEFGLRLVQ